MQRLPANVLFNKETSKVLQLLLASPSTRRKKFPFAIHYKNLSFQIFKLCFTIPSFRGSISLLLFVFLSTCTDLILSYSCSASYIRVADILDALLPQAVFPHGSHRRNWKTLPCRIDAGGATAIWLSIRRKWSRCVIVDWDSHLTEADCVIFAGVFSYILCSRPVQRRFLGGLATLVSWKKEKVSVQQLLYSQYMASMMTDIPRSPGPFRKYEAVDSSLRAWLLWLWLKGVLSLIS